MKVEIYSKDFCPYCDRAKALLEQLGRTYVEKRVDLNPNDFDELRSRAPQARTMPQIFINDHHVGGCDDLYALHDQGKLDQLFED